MYQFLHYETYSINATKKSKSFLSVAREFMRHPDAVPHVEKPLKPQIVYGVDAYEVEKMARERAAIAKDGIGRKLRKDAQVVLSAVASAPDSMSFEELNEWSKQTINWFIKKYGVNFVSAIFHNDESHPHLHLSVIISETSEKGMANLKHLHEPIRARQDTEGGRKVKSDAYKSAYRDLQDEYHAEVSSNFGMLRLGAKKQRLTRAEYNAQKKAAAVLSDLKRQNVNTQQHLSKVSDALKEQDARLLSMQTEISSKETELCKRESTVQKKRESIKKESALLLIEHAKSENKPRNFFMKKVNKLMEDVRQYKDLYQDFRQKYLKLKNAYESLLSRFNQKEKEYDELNAKYVKNITLLKQIKRGEISIKLVHPESYDLD
ncbi:plasmid recombination protein [Vibrio navarrensis]|nr:plasmid recombination protein [Vibrio navarrensis]